MLTRFWLLIGLAIASSFCYSQCLTDFEKLLPEPSVEYSSTFGNAMAMYDDYLAIGIPKSDSLGISTGIVNLYQKINNQWIIIGYLTPSDPSPGLHFGSQLEMTKDYIVVTANGLGGRAYVFKKPVSGWSSQNETVKFDVSTANYKNYVNISLDVAEDQQTIIVGNPFYMEAAAPPGMGAIFVYHKQVVDEWSSFVVPHIILNNLNFIGSNLAIHEDRIITFSTDITFTNTSLLVLKDEAGTFNSYSLEASLSEGVNNDFMGITNFIFTDDGIFTSMRKNVTPSGPQNGIVFFERPANGIWIDSESTCFIDPDGDPNIQQNPVRLVYNGTDIYTAFRNIDERGSLVRLKKNASGWCNPDRELIYSRAPSIAQSDFFGRVLACNQNTNVAVGYINPENGQSSQAIQIHFQHLDNSWHNKSIYRTEKSTAGHFYSNTTLGFDDYLFVGAPNDGTGKIYGGAVYSYKKQGTDWINTGKIVPSFTNVYDDNFGSALASNGTYLAVGGSGFEDHGKTFIYKKTNNDWSNPQLIQVIAPMDTLVAESSGTNILMTNEWLVLPILRNPTAFTSTLCFYKFNGTTWNYHQALDVGGGNVLNKQQAASIDIQGETIVMGNGINSAQIIELTPSGLWQARYTLRPSDPENFTFNYLTGEVYSNGSQFGVSVDINGDNIFVGAPMKDDNQTWDVGAVYVYTKRPEESWSSRTETRKLLPRIRDERELFGYSLKAFNNTIIVGAPGADMNLNGTDRNKPGRAYVFQSKDFYWQDVIPLLDFTGDSFSRDHFGMTVGLDVNDFFIGASIEKNEAGKPAGAVYITPTPPIIKLVPPVCNSEDAIDLFGYPFGGTWAGPGIIDAAEGTFDPKIAGAGIHEFTYQTPSCHYLGRLQIEVQSPPDAILNGDPVRYICEGVASSTILTIQEQPDAQYQWYYRKKSTDAFDIISGTLNTLTVSMTGEYRARVFNRSCENLSSIVIVSFDGNPIAIDPTSVICDDAVKSVTLKATPLGGTWTGDHVSNNVFDASTVTSGNFVVTYSYTSVFNCYHFLSTNVTVDRIPVLNYQRSTGNICDLGSVELSLIPKASNLAFEWQQNTSSGSEIIDDENQKITVLDNGSYQVKISNDYCSRILPPYIIDDKFSLQISPEAQETETCSLIPFFIQSNGRSSDTFNWLYSENSNEEPEILTSNNNPVLEITKDGFYKLQVQRGVCSFESDIKQITILPGDSLYIPNVFSPNDDGKNDVFKVSTLNDYIDLKVINRYGQMIYEGDGVTGWNGGDYPSAVYFWSIVFRDCEGTRQSRKGMVHLVR